jgi:hypothetical protein
MVTTVAIVGLIAVFLGLALSAYAINLTENKGRGELRFLIVAEGRLK